MALVSLPGTSRLYYPFDLRVCRRNTSPPQFGIAATGEKLCLGGRVWHVDRDADDDNVFPAVPNTKYIERVGFKTGTVTLAGGSGITISMQDMAGTGAADQPKPDEVQDQTVAATGLASNAFYVSPLFATTRGVTHQERLCIVVEFDALGRKGADVVNLAGRAAVDEQLLTPFISKKSGGTWSQQQTSWPIVLLDFTDGTLGTLEGGIVSAGEGQVSWNDINVEYGLQFRLPWTCKVEGCAVFSDIIQGANAGYTLKLYQGVNVLGTAISMGGHQASAEIDLKEFLFPGDEITLSAGVDYILGLKPTASSIDSLALLFDTVLQADHKQLVGARGAAAVMLVQRTGNNFWGEVDPGWWPMMGVSISALEA